MGNQIGSFLCKGYSQEEYVLKLSLLFHGRKVLDCNSTQVTNEFRMNNEKKILLSAIWVSKLISSQKHGGLSNMRRPFGTENLERTSKEGCLQFIFQHE